MSKVHGTFRNTCRGLRPQNRRFQVGNSIKNAYICVLHGGARFAFSCDEKRNMLGWLCSTDVPTVAMFGAGPVHIPSTGLRLQVESQLHWLEDQMEADSLYIAGQTSGITVADLQLYTTAAFMARDNLTILHQPSAA